MFIEETQITPQYLKEIRGKFYPTKMWKAPDGYNKIVVSGVISGCGLAQISGVIYLTHTEEGEKILKEIKEIFIEGHGAGGILATLGTTSMSHEPELFRLGFKKIAEYKNLHHAKIGFPDHKQSLYILS